VFEFGTRHARSSCSGASILTFFCFNADSILFQAFEKGEISPDVFEGVLYAVCHQMQQNLYFQFLAHLKAIHKELATQSILLRLSAQPEEVCFLFLFYGLMLSYFWNGRSNRKMPSLWSPSLKR
jgi:hypothetical protein